MNLNRILDLAEKKKIQWSKIAEIAELTSTQGLNYAIENETLKARSLELIAKMLGVSVLEFFENTGKAMSKAEEPASNYGKDYARTAEVKALERKMEDYMKEILKRLPAHSK